MLAMVTSASAAGLEGFEAPVLPAATHTYKPVGSSWAFAGVTGSGIQRNGSAFTAGTAPEGQQTAFLKSADARVSRTVTLTPGVYRVSFMAARRAGNAVNPVQVWLDDRPVGGPLSPPSTAFTRLVSANVTVPAAGSYTLKLGTTFAGNHATFIDAVSIDTINPFDSLYTSTFSLKPLGKEAQPAVAKPQAKATSLVAPSYVDPVFGTRVYRATIASDRGSPSRYVRHDYSRRQAFNADNTRYLAHSEDSFWLLYDANTFKVLPRKGTGGALRDMAGQCEPIWHPTDPSRLWYTGREGGLVWYEKNVETDADDKVIGDFRARIKARWPGATQVWTKGEGTSSADGRYFAFMASHYDEATQVKTIHGLFTWDRETDTILGMLDASQFGNAYPDHISMSPSGKYAVPSWDNRPELGTRAYVRDFSSHRKLLDKSEHSDLAFGPAGQDYYVVTDYSSKQIRAIDLATGGSFDIMSLYPRVGSAYAAHISGQAFGRPGWALISTYDDYRDYGVRPDTTLEAPYRKLMLVELKPGGKQYAVAHTRVVDRWQLGTDGYFGEHQATISRDGSRILFATNFNDQGPASSYMVGLPSWVFVGSTGTPEVPDPGSAPLALTLGTVTRSGYAASFSLTSNVAAKCRMGTQAGTPYGAMYDNLTASSDGRLHTKTTSFGTPGAQTVYIACRADGAGDEKSLVVAIP